MSSYELLRIERMNENTAFLKDLFKDTDIDVSLIDVVYYVKQNYILQI